MIKLYSWSVLGTNLSFTKILQNIIAELGASYLHLNEQNSLQAGNTKVFNIKREKISVGRTKKQYIYFMVGQPFLPQCDAKSKLRP